MYVVLDIKDLMAVAPLEPQQMTAVRPVEGAKKALQKFQDLRYDIIFLSDLDERYRDSAMRWLLETFALDVREERLILRSDGNLLSVPEFKREQITQLFTSMDRSFGVFFISSSPSMWPIFSEFGVVLESPECWASLFPEAPKEEETT